jgi:hypothetical protein
VSKETEKKEFSRFVEDYNTGIFIPSNLARSQTSNSELLATLPHEKYYNMDAYEKRMSALRQGEYLPPANDSYDFNADMKAVSSSHKKKTTTEQESYMSKDQLMELRRVQQERSEVCLRHRLLLLYADNLFLLGRAYEVAGHGCQTKFRSENGWYNV